MFSIDSPWSITSSPLVCGSGAASSSRGVSSSESSGSSRTGFSTSSWVRSVSSSMRVICKSLIACCNEGVITSFCDSLSESFCSSAIQPSLQSEVFSKINFSDLRVRRQLQWGAGAQNLAVVDDIGPVRYFQCFPHVMVGDQDSDAHRLQMPDDSLNVEHGDRVDPRERLVQKDIPRVDHQRPGDLDPAALAAREQAALGAPHLGQTEVEDELVDAPLLLRVGEVQRLEDGPQVVLDRHAPEHRRLLRQVADAALGPQVHGELGDVLVAQGNGAGVGGRQPD